MLNLYEKYKITSFDNFDNEIKKSYSNIISLFKSLNTNNIPNIILYGSDSCGKNTILNCFFKNNIKKKIIFTYKSNSKVIEYIIYKSNDFIEIDLQDLGIYKKYILQNIIKNLTETKKVYGNTNKIIIIHNIHLLSHDDQFIFKKIIEDIKTCRFILISKNLNNIKDIIKSRCFIIKIPGFTKEFIKKKIIKIIKNENINIEQNDINHILDISENNLKKAILELNTYINNKKLYLETKDYTLNTLIKNLVSYIKSINYKKIDEILYKLIINYKINPTIIITKIFDNLNLKDENKIQLIYDLNYEYNKYLQNSQKYIIYLQSYVYKLNKII
jgi:replication factor C subunit 3/5